MTEKSHDRPRFRFSADRHSARRRVRYVESNHPGSGNCTLCELDKLAQGATAEQAETARTVAERQNDAQ